MACPTSTVSCDGNCRDVQIPCSCFEGGCWQEYFRKCCPCCCCCDKASYYFICGSTLLGCCGGGGMVESIPQDKIPQYDYPEFLAQETLNAQEDSGQICSIPCDFVIAHLRSTCCLICNGSMISEFKRAGTVSATISGKACSPWIFLLNGQIPPVYAYAGEALIPTLITISPCTDCCCAFLGYCTGRPDETPCEGNEMLSEDIIIRSRLLDRLRKLGSTSLYKYQQGKLQLNKQFLNYKLAQLSSEFKPKFGANIKFRPINKNKRDTKRKWL